MMTRNLSPVLTPTVSLEEAARILNADVDSISLLVRSCVLTLVSPPASSWRDSGRVFLDEVVHLNFRPTPEEISRFRRNRGRMMWSRQN